MTVGIKEVINFSMWIIKLKKCLKKLKIVKNIIIENQEGISCWLKFIKLLLYNSTLLFSILLSFLYYTIIAICMSVIERDCNLFFLVGTPSLHFIYFLLLKIFFLFLFLLSSLKDFHYPFCRWFLFVVIFILILLQIRKEA